MSVGGGGGVGGGGLCGYWRCTYTAQLAKKHKTFVDGFVRLSCGGCKLTLLAASQAGLGVCGGGRELDSSLRAQPFALQADDELRLDGHIVRIDEPVLALTAADSQSPAAAAGTAGPDSHRTAPVAPAALRRGSLPRRSTFRPPARVAPVMREADGSTALSNHLSTAVKAERCTAAPRSEPDWTAGQTAQPAPRSHTTTRLNQPHVDTATHRQHAVKQEAAAAQAEPWQRPGSDPWELQPVASPLQPPAGRAHADSSDSQHTAASHTRTRISSGPHMRHSFCMARCNASIAANCASLSHTCLHSAVLALVSPRANCFADLRCPVADSRQQLDVFALLGGERANVHTRGDPSVPHSSEHPPGWQRTKAEEERQPQRRESTQAAASHSSKPSAVKRRHTAAWQPLTSEAASDAELLTSVRLSRHSTRSDGDDDESRPISLPVTSSAPSALRPHKPLSFDAASQPSTQTPPQQPPLHAAAEHSAAFAYTTHTWEPKATPAHDTSLEADSTAERKPLLPLPSRSPLRLAPTSTPLPAPSSPAAALGCSLRFMSARSPHTPPLSIPDVFTSVAEYQLVFVAAMSEQINRQLGLLAQKFVAVAQKLSPAAQGSAPFSSQPQLQRDRDAQAAYRHAQMSYYQQAALYVKSIPEHSADSRPTYKQRMEQLKKERRRKQQRGRATHKRTAAQRRSGEAQEQRAGDEDDGGEGEAEEELDEEEEDAGTAAADGGVHLWLGLTDSSAKEKGTEYGQDDLWLLSNDALFGWRARSSSSQPPQYAASRHRQPWVIFAVSEWRSFTERRGEMKLRLLAVEGSTVQALPIRKQTPVYGIRAQSLKLQMRQCTSHTLTNNAWGRFRAPSRACAADV